MQHQANQTHSEVFISYCDRDRDRILQITKSLEAASVRVWVDRDRVETGGRAVSGNKSPLAYPVSTVLGPGSEGLDRRVGPRCEFLCYEVSSKRVSQLRGDASDFRKALEPAISMRPQANIEVRLVLLEQI